MIGWGTRVSRCIRWHTRSGMLQLVVGWVLHEGGVLRLAGAPQRVSMPSSTKRWLGPAQGCRSCVWAELCVWKAPRHAAGTRKQAKGVLLFGAVLGLPGA